jgi:hypothetical protein
MKDLQWFKEPVYCDKKTSETGGFFLPFPIIEFISYF